MKTDNDRFTHVCQDNNLRWKQSDKGLILEQQRYSNRDKDGKWLVYPETRWIEVEHVGEKTK